jgi:hypothetical protein
MAIAKTGWAAHWNGGHVILHTPRRSYFLLGPSDHPVFTELYDASTRRVMLGGGWRIVARKRD